MEAAAEAGHAPSLLARVDRLDLVLGYMEELRGGSARSTGATSTTASSGAVTASSDGGNSSVDGSSPRSLDRRRCRPITDVVAETQLKGNLVERVGDLELRLVKLEENIMREKKMREAEKNSTGNGGGGGVRKKSRGSGLKRMVKFCVTGDLKTKD